MDEKKGEIRDYLSWFGSGYYYVIERRNKNPDLQFEVENFMANSAKELMKLFDEYKKGKQS